MDERGFDLDAMDTTFLQRFRDALSRVGYTADTIGRKTGELALPFSSRSKRELVYRYLFGASPALMTAFSIFLSDASVSRADAEALFGGDLCGDLLSRGILRKAGFRKVECPFHLFPFGDGWIFTDGAGMLLDSDRRNAVFHLLQEQEILASAMIRERVTKVLDLCTGSGVFAITASRFADQVVAVDINARALNFVGMNGLLNQVSNVKPVRGDLYSGLEGQTFELILANPPYNPTLGSAEDRTLSLHAGPSGGDVLDVILRGLPAALADNGVCQIVTRIFFLAGQSFLDRLATLIEPDGFNVFVMQTQPRPIFTLSNLEKTGWSVPPNRQTALFDHYRADGIDRESFGVVNLRKVAGGGRYSEAIVNFDHLRQTALSQHVKQAL